MAVAYPFSFRSIDSTSHYIFKEKGSKFLAFAFRVVDEKAVKTHLDELRKKYFDATHHCYAWILGADKTKFRAFDDGEPNHSAGTPILGQIRSRDLTNILVVIVRYFGGTKLGVSGLTQAYKASADGALKNATIVEIELTANFSLTYDYSHSADVVRLSKEFDLGIVNQTYMDRASSTVNVKLRLKQKFVEKLQLLNALGSVINFRELYDSDTGE